jgi:acyl-CoA reductase-like NAD-dependent aldehyde dehydrogenase
MSNHSKMKDVHNLQEQLQHPLESQQEQLDVDAIRKPMQELHDAGDNFNFAWRKRQLQQLRSMLMDHWDDWVGALRVDLGKCTVEAVATELLMVCTDLDYTLQHLHVWMKPTPIPSPAVCIPAYSKVQYRPLLGPAVLILGPSNYPLSLTLHPAIGALAAGNPVVMKPSELTPTVANLLSQLVNKYFPSNVMVCVTGGIPETTKLLQYSWGRIFFTGSSTVGRIVAQAAALSMSPITLELGGKSPCYIDAESTSYDNDNIMGQIAQRIVWSKTLNAGQTCAATDTLICCQSMISNLLPHLASTLISMFGTNPQYDSEIGRIVTVRNAERLVDMIKEVEDYIISQDNMDNPNRCQIITGGSKMCNASERFVAPTIVLNPPNHCRMMQEEIFGPVLPIVTVASRDDAVEYMRHTMMGTPLCLYVFTSSESVFQTIVQQVPAGSVVRNDCLVHLCSPYIPFGGLGTSGYGGTYHGRHTFELFSHALPIMYRPYVWPSFLWDWNQLRCHPFTPLKHMVTVNVVIQLPAIPVLNVRFYRRIGIFIALSVGTMWYLSISSSRPVSESIADILEIAARQVMKVSQNLRHHQTSLLSKVSISHNEL